MKIDIHAHIIAPEILRDQNPAETWRPRVLRDEQGRQKVDHDGKVIGSPIREFVHIDGILAEQDAAGIDVVALSPWSALFNYNFPAEECVRTCRVQNESLARLVNAHPDRLVGMGIVPLQDTRLAAREAERIVRELGLRAIEIGTNVTGTYLGNEALLPFWETVAGLGVLVFVHPVSGVGGPMMSQYYLWNMYGNPSETGLTAADLILSGTLERFPSLKILLSHGGGTLPSIIGRLDRGFQVRPEPKARITRPPSTFLPQFYFDTIAHSTEALRYLLRLTGADHVLLGSDYPFDMGNERPQEVVDALGLPAQQAKAILGDTAAGLLGLEGKGK
jgi:aminocarboxymuconate-semialdehyde decarboxylase